MPGCKLSLSLSVSVSCTMLAGSRRLQLYVPHLLLSHLRTFIESLRLDQPLEFNEALETALLLRGFMSHCPLSTLGRCGRGWRYADHRAGK